MPSVGFIHVLTRLVAVLSVLAACSLSVGLSPAAVHAASWVDGVGSRVPFNRANSLDLAAYCNGADTVDDTRCIDQWLYDQKTQGKDGYVSPGTYLVSYYYQAFSNMRIKCADPTTTVFKKMSGHNEIWGFDADLVPGTVEPMQDVSIENCGFDMHGFLTDGLGVLNFEGLKAPINHITLRGNRVFDSTMPGSMCTRRDCERAYFVLANAADILIENNHFSEGGRLRVGDPLVRTVIRNNTLFNINDNGITIVDYGEDGLSSDILIEGNTITNPIGSGVFFGADGQGTGSPAMTLQDVTIRNNTVTGDFGTACIQGTLPNNVARIFIAHNTCRKTGPVPTGVFTTGIALSRNLTSTRYAEDITVQNNTIQADVSNARAGIYIGSLFENLCLLSNRISGHTARAIYLASDMRSVKVTGNELNGGLLRIGPNVQVDQSGNTSECFVASP